MDDVSRRSVAAVLGGLLSLAAACGPAEEASRDGGDAGPPQPGGTAVLCSQAAAESLNPFVSPAQGAVDLSALLFTPLVRYGEDGAVVPRLARGWSWEDDRRRLRLRLRGDVRWHDGRRVTPEDVAWTLSAAADPDYGYWNAQDLAPVRSAEAVDDSTVEVVFESPFVAGLEPLVTLPVLPRHILGDLSPEEFSGADYHRSPVGSGPFRFVERRADGVVRLAAWEEHPEELGSVHLDGVALRVVPEVSSMAAEFRTGGVDACVTTSSAASRLQSVPDVELLPLEPAGMQVVVLNTRHPPFADPRVRRALSAALDRSEIAAVVSPLARPSGNPLPTSSPWRVEEMRQPDADPERARALLDSAGWTSPGTGATRTGPTGDELRFTLVAPTPLEDPLTVVQSQLGEVGIGVELRFMEWASFVGLLQDPGSRPEAMALGFQPEKMRRPDLRGMLHSEGGSNLSGYADPRMDSLLAAASAATRPDTLRSLYHRVQKLAATEVPMIYTLEVPRVLAVGPRLRGVDPGIGSPYASVAEWWIPREAR